MALEIPIRSDLPHYEEQVQLDGVTYSLRFRWNEREDAWYFSLYDEAGDAITVGVRVVVSWPLAARVTDPRMPPGAFFAIDSSGQKLDPGELDMGDRVRLFYYEEDELPLDEEAA